MLAAGEQIGPWVVIRSLGSGGMGSVYLCHDHRSDRLQAAVKLFHARSEDQRARFLREVEALHRLRHPTIVRTSGWGEADGQLFLAMEYVEGRELGQIIREGPMDRAQALRLFAQLADGLAHAHLHGITHRDLKPANILITPTGEGRLVDFGIAADAEQSRLTQADVVAGTIAYLPLEALRTDPPPLLPPMDVFALTQCLAEVLLGRELFPTDGRSRDQHFYEVIQARKSMDGVDPGEAFSPSIRALVRTNTATDPEQRLSMIQLRDRLGSLVLSVRGRDFLVDEDAETRWVAFDVPSRSSSAPTPTPPPPPPPSPSSSGGARMWLLGLLAGSVAISVALLGGGGVYLLAHTVLARTPAVEAPRHLPQAPAPPPPPHDTGSPPDAEDEEEVTAAVPEASEEATVVSVTPHPRSSPERPPAPPPETVTPEAPLTQRLCVFYPGEGGADVNVEVTAAARRVMLVLLVSGSYRCTSLDAGGYTVSAKAKRREDELPIALEAGREAHVRVVFDPEESKTDRLKLQKASSSQANLAGLRER